MNRGLCAALALALLTALVPPAVAEDGPTAPAPPDSSTTATDPLSTYLDDLAAETDDTFDIDLHSISDAELDSLIQIYEETGRSPYSEDARASGLARWDLDLGVKGLRYNRVEGLNLTAHGSVQAPTSRTLKAFGELGYAWALEKATWIAGLRARLADRGGAPTLEANHGRQVPVYGSGDIPGNSAAALFLGKDYGDYFVSDRWSFWLQFSPGPVRFDLNYRIEEQGSVRKQTDWSFFEKNSDFRENPRIDEGEVRLLRVLLGVGDVKFGALAAELEAVTAGHWFEGDFEYESIRAEVIARRTLWFGDQITGKVVGGATSGEAPFQALHHLGGFRTLRGYEINEIPARQFAHVRLDYRLGTDLLGFVPLANRLRLQLTPFFDGVAIFELQARDGTVIDPGDPRYRFSGGVGIQKNLLGIPGGSGQLRLDIAKRLDRDRDAMTYRLLVTMER